MLWPYVDYLALVIVAYVVIAVAVAVGELDNARTHRLWAYRRRPAAARIPASVPILTEGDTIDLHGKLSGEDLVKLWQLLDLDGMPSLVEFRRCVDA